jgi:hypothetical protein
MEPRFATRRLGLSRSPRVRDTLAEGIVLRRKTSSGKNGGKRLTANPQEAAIGEKKVPGC